MKRRRIGLLAVVIALTISFFAFDVGRYLSLDYLQAHQSRIENYFQAHPWRTTLLFFALYVAVTGLSLPGAAVLTLAAGAVFGLVWGTVVVSFASTLGATLAFLLSRFLLRDWVRSRFGGRLKAIDAGVVKDGAFYLFTLRLIPLFPFFLINLAMGLTPLRTWTFYWVSQLGMLAGTLVYVNAGARIAEIDSPRGVLSPALLLSFVLLGLFPLLARKAVAAVAARRALRPYKKPRRFDRNLVVIGAGSAGLVCAYIAAAVKAKVTLIEKERMGGDCLNTGCIPSKALLRSARFLSDARRSQEFGVRSARVEFDFADIMERAQRLIAVIAPHDSVERYAGLGVECLQGEARITSPYTVEASGRVLTTHTIIIASGARPSIPPIPGLDRIAYLTSDTIWGLRELPRRLAVLGGGPIGCELAQAFARFGSQVTLVEMLPRLLSREDPEISALVQERFQAEGVRVLVGHKAKAFLREDDQQWLVCECNGQEARIPFDQVLIALGRTANTAGFGLEDLGIALTPAGTIEVNDYLQTRLPNIYAVGDVVGPYQFTHTAAHQAWFATVNALFGGLKKFKVDYSVIPWATFTEPEVARVGLNEQEAREKGVPYEVARFDMAELDRAIVDSEAHGLVKVLTTPGKDRILGATIVGAHAGDSIIEYVTAMRHNLGLNKILSTIHIYPTLAEANKYAAGVWKKAHAPPWALRWLARFHAWRRGGAAG